MVYYIFFGCSNTDNLLPSLFSFLFSASKRPFPINPGSRVFEKFALCSIQSIINDLACKLCVSKDRSGMQLSISPNPGWIIYIFTDIPKRFRCAFRFLEAVACEWSNKSSHCRSLLHINRFSSVQIISNLSHISISSYYVHSHFI